METKEKILEGLEHFKRADQVNGIINRCMNHLFDAYRELEMAIEHCDEPNMRNTLENVRDKIGYDKEIAGYIDNEASTVISELQDLLGDYKVNE